MSFAQFAAAAVMVNSLCQILLGPALGWFLDLTGNDYGSTFLVGSMIGGMTLLAGVVLLRSRSPLEQS
ncbi:MAG TPA: hypothetical protein PLN52_06225 [Opitutaceae bacterium]|nr:hypothetical protein [Opitutaceae bacterium]